MSKAVFPCDVFFQSRSVSYIFLLNMQFTCAFPKSALFILAITLKSALFIGAIIPKSALFILAITLKSALFEDS